jgi:hypothetical protein
VRLLAESMDFLMDVAVLSQSGVFPSSFIILSTHIVKNSEFAGYVADSEHEMWARSEKIIIRTITDRQKKFTELHRSFFELLSQIGDGL